MESQTAGSMDLKARERSWLLQLDQVFKDESTVSGLTVRGRISETQNSLKNLLHKRLKVWWNKAFLEKYLQRNLIPRGLRIQVFPSFPIVDETFTTRWEEVCTNSSCKFMTLLIGHNKQVLEQLEKDIESLQKQLSENSTPEANEIFNKALEKQFDIWEKEIREIKTKKFSRDLNDLQQKRMYRWHQNRPRKRMSRTSSFSSASSGGETNDRPMITRLSAKTKRKDNHQKNEGNRWRNDGTASSETDLKQ